MKKISIAIFSTLLIISLSISLMAQSFSKDITKVDVGQTKAEVEKVMGPPDEMTTQDGIPMSMWKLSVENFVAIMVAYGKDGKVGIRMVMLKSTFEEEMKDATEAFGKPTVQDKNRAVWKAENLYIIVSTAKDGLVNIMTCTEEMFKK